MKYAWVVNKASIILAATLLGGLSAPAASISFGRDVRYPTKWQAATVNTPGGGQIVMYPTEFATRRLGTGLQVKRVGAVRIVGRNQGKPVYELQPPEGPAFVAQQGQRVKSGDREYLPMGWHGSNFNVIDLKTRETIAFRKVAVQKPATGKAVADAVAKPASARALQSFQLGTPGGSSVQVLPRPTRIPAGKRTPAPPGR